MLNNVILRREQQVLADTKWQKFLRRTWLFRYIPFVEVVFGSGSLALGTVNENSDFDVLICATSGHIFTARFFCVVAFSLFGWRRTKLDHRIAAKDKVCLNHFVTRESYHLSLAPNEYWRALYQQLVPLYGSEQAVQEFFSANHDWLKSLEYQPDIRHQYKNSLWFKVWLERLLSGSFGMWVEKKLKAFQVKRIERGLPHQNSDQLPGRVINYKASQTKKSTYHLPPLIRYSDTELEFHPDPATLKVLY